MWMVLGVGLVYAVGIVVALLVARRGKVVLAPLPWQVFDSAKLHVPILGGLAGFSITGIVIIAGLARSQTGWSEPALATVVVMFVVSFLFYISNAFLLSYLPNEQTAGETVCRLHFSLASTIEYRTVFLSWFALMPLLQANGLTAPASVLAVILPLSLVLGTIVIAMVADSLGLITFAETYLLLVLGAVLVLALVGLAHLMSFATGWEYAGLAACLVVFALNGLGFGLAGATPLASRYPAVHAFFTRHGRKLVLVDMQLTAMTQVLLWLAVVGAL